MTIQATASTFVREVPVRQHGKEEGMLLDLGKISLGTLNDVEEKKQYLSTVQLEKQRIQNYTLRMVYENAYQLYKQGDYQRAQELAQTILSIDPNFKQAETLAKQIKNNKKRRFILTPNLNDLHAPNYITLTLICQY